MKKYCSRCKKFKDLDEFCRNRARKDGRNNYCKLCCRERDQLPYIREQHKRAFLRFKLKSNYSEVRKKYDKTYRKSDVGKAALRTYNKKHKEKLKLYHKKYAKEWAKTNVGKASLKKARQKFYYKDLECSRRLRREDYYKRKQKVEYRISDAVSSVIYEALKKNKKGWRWEKLVGYTALDLMKHLESLFQIGMSWNNYGEWHIDHIIPRSRFHFSSADDEEFKQCWSLNNLQPLWALDNIKKRDN